jgi:osmoprotectant transport system ATP-binding protein
MTATDAAVEFRDVSYTIHTPDRGVRTILNSVSFTVAAGETLVLLGRSGSGKTTALKMTNGMLNSSSGTVCVQGRDTREWDPIRLKRHSGYVIQEVGLFPHFTVAENIGLVPKLEGWEQSRIDRRVDELLDAVSLPPNEFRARYPRQLSGGQKQRVGVARALAADPGLLLFDEPFGALDPVTRFDLQEQFLQWRRDFGKTAIFVTHDVREAMRLGTRIVLLVNGHVDLIASPEEFRRMETPEARAFLREYAA